MALACASGALAGLRFTRPLILVEGVVIGIRALEISREARGVVSMHASARDGRAPAAVAPLLTAVAVDVRVLYSGLAAGGLMYGPSFRTVARAWTGREAVAAAVAAGHKREGYRVHPATTDGMLHSMAATAGATATQVPASIGGVGLAAGASSAALVWSCTRSTLATASESRARCALVRRLNVDDFCSRALPTAAGSRDKPSGAVTMVWGSALVTSRPRVVLATNVIASGGAFPGLRHDLEGPHLVAPASLNSRTSYKRRRLVLSTNPRPESARAWVLVEAVCGAGRSSIVGVLLCATGRRRVLGALPAVSALVPVRSASESITGIAPRDALVTGCAALLTRPGIAQSRAAMASPLRLRLCRGSDAYVGAARPAPDAQNWAVRSGAPRRKARGPRSRASAPGAS